MSSGGVLARAVVVLEGDDSKLEAVMSDAEKKMNHLGERMSKIGETMTHKVTLPLLAAGTLAVHSFGEQEDAMARVEGVIASTGGTAGVTAEHIKDLAESLQQTTTFADQATEAAAAVVLSFTNIRNEAGKGNDIFDRTIKVGQDLSELMGKDLQGAFAALGKTMEDPEQGMMLLRRANVILAPAVKQTIKDLLDQGKVLEAQKMVLDAVEKATGGLAARMAKTPLGQMKQAWNEVDDALEDVGKQLASLLVLPVAEKAKDWAHEFRKFNESTQRTIVMLGIIVGLIGPMLVVLGTAIKVSALLSVVFSGLANAIGPLIVSFTGAAGGAGAFTVGTTAILAPVALAIAALLSFAAAALAVAENWTWVKIQLGLFITFLLDKFVGAILFVLETLAKIPVVGEKMFGGLRDTVAQSLEDMLADSGRSIGKMEDELNGVGTAVKKTVDKLNKPSPRPPAWLGGVTIALKELRDALELVDVKTKVLGDQFDSSSATASAYASAVDAIAKTHVGLDVVLDNTGRTLRGMMKTMQSLNNQAVTDKLALTLKDAARQAGAIGNGFDLAAARSAAYDEAVNALIAAHVGLDVVLNKTGLTLRKLLDEAEKAKIDVAVNDLTNALGAAGTMASVLGANYDRTSAQAQAYAAIVQTLIAAHVSLDTVIGDTGMTLEEMIKKMQMLEQAAQLQNRLKQVFTDLGDYVVDFAFGAKQSFGDFVKQTLQDITKLIIKMMILNALKEAFNPTKGGVLGGIGKVLGFAKGGFIAPGDVGMVGERGPELISGGRNGINVTPIPASGVTRAGDSGGAPMILQFNVNAIDSKGVAEFFEDNQGMVASAMMRASQRSSALRRRFG